MPKHTLSLFIFRRDLRLYDNTGLRAALENSDRVAPLFILDPRQAGPENPYRGLNALAFMADCLNDLAGQLQTAGGQLLFFSGPAEEVLGQLLSAGGAGTLVDSAGRRVKPDAVYLNRDYTPFSRRRDRDLAEVCGRHDVAFHAHNDLLLNEPEATVKPNGEPYSVFTPFFRRARQLPIPTPRALPRDSKTKWFATKKQNQFTPARFTEWTGAMNANWKSDHGKASKNSDSKNETDAGSFLDDPTKPGATTAPGGRTAALGILKSIGDHADYEQRRDIPSIQGTTGLSPHNKFGTLSPREFFYAVHKKLGADHPLIRQLYWRDFLTSIGYYFPHVFGRAFRPLYDKIRWSRKRKLFEAWRDGRTGFPIVDAGMRELAATGNMHNRVRMITASFFVKDLHLDWRIGEKYFARNLIDYDPAVNNGNWQWAASTGCDAQPYFRVFNPWLQQKKFDPEGDYVRRWLPELSEVPPAVLRNPAKFSNGRPADYPAPIVDHAAAAAQAKEMFRSLK